MQKNFNVGLWDELVFNLAAERNDGIVSGVLAFEWTDEWSKGGNPGIHDASYEINYGQPDSYNDEKWFGLLHIDRTPKQAYYGMRSRFTLDGQNGIPLVSNPVLTATSGGAAILELNGKTVFSRAGGGSGGHGLNIAILDEQTGVRIKEYRHFDTWYKRDTAAYLQSVADYLSAIPNGSIVMIAVADNSGLYNDVMDEPVYLALEAMGSTQIRTAPPTSWAMIAKKGTGKFAETSTTSPITATPTLSIDPNATRRQALAPVVNPPIIECKKTAEENFRFTFQSQDAFVYQIDFCDDLKIDEWKLAQRGIVADGASTKWTDDGSFTGALPARRFYRVVVIDRANRF